MPRSQRRRRPGKRRRRSMHTARDCDDAATMSPLPQLSSFNKGVKVDACDPPRTASLREVVRLHEYNALAPGTTSVAPAARSM
jgi:hypothetical protein